MSIKPEFIKEIIKGNKKFEYRKKLFKRTDITSIAVYATKPYGKVVGEFEIEQILVDTPNNIWEQTKKQSGISQNFFNDYFKGYPEAIAIQIKEFIKYEKPMDLLEFDNSLKVAPQSFCYTDGGF